MDTIVNNLLNKVVAEAEAGFPNLRGTNVLATLPISETLVNEVVPSVGGSLAVSIQSNNRLNLRILGLPTPIDATIVGIDSSLTLKLRVSAPAKLLLSLPKIKGKLPFFGRVQGDNLFFDFGQIPLVFAWRCLWPYVRIGISTYPGRIYMSVTLKVD